MSGGQGWLGTILYQRERMQIANDVKSWLGMLGSTKFAIGIIQAKGTDGIPEQLVGFTHDFGKAFEKISSHAN
jgi:hypothetical protein